MPHKSRASRSLCLISLLILLCHSSLACLLCPLHIPARPKPLDQFRLPSIQKLVQTAETFEWLCQNGSRLDQVSEQCRAEVSHLFCSLTELAHSLRLECPGPEDEQACGQCRRENDRKYSNNKWILTWIDSVGKMPSGISDGNYHWLGDYEQCQTLKNDGLFNGRYCLLDFHVPDAVLRPEQCERGNEPLQVVLGVCLPANCSQKETRGLIEHVADHRPIQVRCEPPRHWSVWSLLFVGVCLSWLSALLALSTLLWLRPSLFPRSAILHSLTLQFNLRHSLRTTRSPAAPFSAAIQGLQTLCTAMLVLGQAQVLVMPFLENIGHHYSSILDAAVAQPVVNFSMYADGLFVLSTFQLAQRYAREISSVGELLRVLKRRFLRLWPPYAFCTLAMALVFSRLGEGPMWSRSDIAQRCEHSWAVNLVLASNLLGHSYTCLDAGFVFALEAQFLLLSLCALWLLPRHRRALLFALCSLLLLSVVFSLVVSLRFGAPPTLIAHRMESHPAPSHQSIHTVQCFLLRTLCRPSLPEPAGQGGPIPARPAVRTLGGALTLRAEAHPPSQSSSSRMDLDPSPFWALSPLGSLFILVSLALLLWTPFWLSSWPSPSSALYSASHRTLWALFLLLLVLLLDASGERNALNAFLCWRCFHPLSKLIYPVLLLSEPIALSLFSSLHRPVHSTPISIVLTWVGILVCSFILALLIDVCLTRQIRRICGAERPAEVRMGQQRGERKGAEQSAD